MNYFKAKKSIAERLALTAIRRQTADGMYILNASDLAVLDTATLTANGDIEPITLKEARAAANS